MGNAKPSREREMKMISSPEGRITIAEKEFLIQYFEKIQTGMIITPEVFRTEILGYQVPEIIANRFYDLFSSRRVEPLSNGAAPIHERQKQPGQEAKVMTLDDFFAFYVVFKKKEDNEMAQAVFSMFCLQRHMGNQLREEQFKEKKYTNENPIQGRQDASKCSQAEITLLSKQILGLSDKDLSHFYLKSRFDYNLMVTLEDFLENFKYIKTSPVVTWVADIVMGFNLNNMNVDNLEQNSLRLSEVKEHLAKRETDVDLRPEEIQNITYFIKNEVRNHEPKEIVKVFTKMFRDIKKKKLRKYLIQSKIAVNCDFGDIMDLIITVCRNRTPEDIFNFSFVLFSKSSEFIKKQGLIDFAEVFGLPKNFFAGAKKLNLEQLDRALKGKKINLSVYKDAIPMMTSIFALTPANDKEEKYAILASLHGNKDLDSYIYEHLPQESEFFVIEKTFWNQWCHAMNWEEDTEYGLKMERKERIENMALMEPNHQFRMKDLMYKQDYILVPKFVFYPLSKWYSCDKVITKQVIKYQNRRANDQNSMLSSHHSQRFMMSNQKFYNTKENDYDEDLVHRVGDVVYELEINPRLIYLSKISDNGERLHKAAVVNFKIDQNYLKKVLKTDKLPFEELELSKKTTFSQVLNTAAKLYNGNPKQGRLLIEDTIISGSKLYMTLGEYGINIGQLVFAEFTNAQNEWPSQFAKQSQQIETKQSTITDDAKSKILTSGLQNMGNTCYMNSALQVIANLKVFHEYFVAKQMHKKQTNLKNPLGYQGDLVNEFGDLMELLYQDPEKVILPREFKELVSECCEQFDGFDQQDSQEYLSFMIDGLHEELNLRSQKPFLTNPESKDREIEELGLEHWANSLRRDWSLIYFLFYGQIKSSLICKTCKFESTTFDIFSQLSLSLPEPTQVTLSIIVYRLPNKIKDILNGKFVKDEKGDIKLGLQQEDSVLTDKESDSGVFSVQSTYQRLGSRVQSSRQSNRDKKHMQQFTDQYNYNTNDQPIHIHLKVEKDIRIKDLITKICQIREVNVESSQLKTELLLFQLNKDRGVRGIFSPQAQLLQYNTNGMDIQAIESLTQTGREVIANFYHANPTFLQTNGDALLKSLTFVSDKFEMNKQRMNKNATMDLKVQTKNNNQLEKTGQPFSKTAKQLDKYDIFNQAYHNHDKKTDFTRVITTNRKSSSRISDDNEMLPDTIFVVCYHRRFVKKENNPFQQFQPQLIATPILLSLTRKPSGRRVYDEVWAIASNFLSPDCKYQKPSVRWWERRDWPVYLKSSEGLYKPFIIKTVDRQGYACSRCHWTLKCSGCIIEPTDAPIYIEDLLNNSFLVIEWNSETVELFYNQTMNEVVQHSSVFERPIDTDMAYNYSTLDETLTNFHKREVLDSPMNCTNCKAEKPHTKRLSVFRLPPILVIQLKRFRQVGNAWRKSQTLVDFPIHNLNMEQYAPRSKFQVDQEISGQYDLHGIVNHYGTMGYGHYSSFVKNSFDQTWYKYDDNERQQIKEEQIEKESAYLLFYIRKDVIDKDLSKLLPNIETSFFPGKPVTLKGETPKQGFIMEVVAEDTFVIKLKDEETPKRYSLAELLEETDKNEIKYNETEMKDIEANKHKQQTAAVIRTQKTTQCCGRLSKKEPDPEFMKSYAQIKVASDVQAEPTPNEQQKDITIQENPDPSSSELESERPADKNNRAILKNQGFRTEVNSARAKASSGLRMRDKMLSVGLAMRADDHDVNRSQENLLMRLNDGIQNN